MFLVIFATLNKGAAPVLAAAASRTTTSSSRASSPTALIATTFVNMAISTAILRDEGILKRMQGTPLPRWAYVAARIGSTLMIVGAMTALTLVLGATRLRRRRSARRRSRG